MGRTNIRKATDFIDRAGTVTDEMAVIPQLDDLQLPLHITCRSFSAPELGEYDAVLRLKHSGNWNTSTNGNLTVHHSFSECRRVPHVTISPGLKNF